MPSKNKELPNPATMTEEELVKFEIAEELGLADKVLAGGWRTLTAKESGRIGGILAGRRRKAQKE